MRSLWLTLISACGLQLAAFSQTTPINRGKLLSNLDGNQKSITNVHLSASDLTSGTVGSAVLTGSNAYNGSFTGDGGGLTNLNSSLALGSNNWWLATNTPGAAQMTNNTALAGVVTGVGIGTNFPAAQTNWPFSAITNFNAFTALGSNDWWLATNVPVVDISSFLTNLDARSWTNWTGIYGNGVGISNLDLTLAFGTNNYMLGGTNYVFVTNINDTLTGLKSVTNLIQWIINPVNGSGLVGGRLGSGVLWITLGGQPVYGYSPNSFNIYTNAFFQSSLTATNPANVLAGDGLGLTNLNPPLALGSNNWWLATNSPASAPMTNNSGFAGVVTGLGIGTNLPEYLGPQYLAAAGTLPYLDARNLVNLPPQVRAEVGLGGVLIKDSMGKVLALVEGGTTNQTSYHDPQYVADSQLSPGYSPVTTTWSLGYRYQASANYAIAFLAMEQATLNALSGTLTVVIWHADPATQQPLGTALGSSYPFNLALVRTGASRGTNTITFPSPVAVTNTGNYFVEYRYSNYPSGQTHYFFGSYQAGVFVGEYLLLSTNSGATWSTNVDSLAKPFQVITGTDVTRTPGQLSLYADEAKTAPLTNLWFGPLAASTVGFTMAGSPPTLTLQNGTNGPANLTVLGSITGNGAGLTSLPAVWGGLSNTAASGTNVIVANARTTIQNGGANTLVVTNGSVGLGTATPTALLTVNGTASFSNDVAIVGASSDLTIAGTVIGNTTITATTGFLLPTNYTAAAFIPTTAMGTLVISNAVLYFVTNTQTNLISDGR